MGKYRSIDLRPETAHTSGIKAAVLSSEVGLVCINLDSFGAMTLNIVNIEPKAAREFAAALIEVADASEPRHDL